MKILVIYRHYWPDSAPYAAILKEILERLVQDGHSVTVFSAQPSYNNISKGRRPMAESIGGVKVLRMPLAWEKKSIFATRLLNTGLFLGGGLLFGLTRKQVDLAMTGSTPAIVSGGVTSLLKHIRGTPFLYHCQDLHPEAAIFGGKLDRGVMSRLMMFVEKLSHKAASSVVVLSEDMARTVRERGLPGDNISVVNNFAVAGQVDTAPELPLPLSKQPGVFRVIFAGNHGVFQGLETVIEAAHMLAAEEMIHFQLIGEGQAKGRLIEQAGQLVGRTVFFHPYVQPEVAFRVMQESDLALVPLLPNVYKVAYPSKTMTCLAAGLPVLVSVEPDCALAEFVKKERVGWVCPPMDAGAMARTILEAFQARHNGGGCRERALDVASRHFGKDVVLGRWSDLINDLAGGDVPPVVS